MDLRRVDGTSSIQYCRMSWEQVRLEQSCVAFQQCSVRCKLIHSILRLVSPYDCSSTVACASLLESLSADNLAISNTATLQEEEGGSAFPHHCSQCSFGWDLQLCCVKPELWMMPNHEAVNCPAFTTGPASL